MTANHCLVDYLHYHQQIIKRRNAHRCLVGCRLELGEALHVDRLIVTCVVIVFFIIILIIEIIITLIIIPVS